MLSFLKDELQNNFDSESCKVQTAILRRMWFFSEALSEPWSAVTQFGDDAGADGRGQARQRCLCVLMESWCQVSRQIGSKVSLEDKGAWACPSVWGELTMSHSPDVGIDSLGKLRSSSATQEKLQYPLGMPVAAALPANGSPAKTETTFRKSYFQSMCLKCLRAAGDIR